MQIFHNQLVTQKMNIFMNILYQQIRRIIFIEISLMNVSKKLSNTSFLLSPLNYSSNHTVECWSITKVPMDSDLVWYNISENCDLRALLEPEGLRVFASIDDVFPDTGGSAGQLGPGVLHLRWTREALLHILEGRIGFILSASKRLCIMQLPLICFTFRNLFYILW